MDGVFTAFAVLLFAAVILMLEGAWLWWSGAHGGAARRIAKRLRLMAATGQGGIERVDILKRRVYSSHPALDKQLRRIARLAALDRLLMQAGVRWSVAQFLGGALAMVLAGLLLPQMIGMPFLPAVGTLALLASLPWLLLLRIRGTRLRKDRKSVV